MPALAAPALESEPPAESGIWRVVKWVIAYVAVLVGFFALMVAGSSVSVIVQSFVLAAQGMGEAALDAVLASDASELRASIAGQVAVLVVYLPIWRHVRKRAFAPARRRHRRASASATSVLGIAIAGLGLQLFLGYVLGYVLQYFPDLATEYNEIMESGGTDELSLGSVLTVAILAPVIEETTCRGLMFEFLLRAFTPGWNRRDAERGMRPARAAVVAALMIQALTFGCMHLNIVQGTYAFVMGMLFGWAFWRTGSLCWSAGLHLAVNFSSFLVDALGAVFDPLGYAACIVLFACVSAAGLALFARGTRAGGAAGQSARALEGAARS